MSSGQGNAAPSGHADLTAAIVRGDLTVQQAVARIAHERDADTRAFLVPCAGCGTLHYFAETYSPCLWLAGAGSRYAGGFQMAEANGPSAPPHQHFCCSEACLATVALDCLQNHYLPAARARHQQAQAQAQAVQQDQGGTQP